MTDHIHHPQATRPCRECGKPVDLLDSATVFHADLRASHAECWLLKLEQITKEWGRLEKTVAQSRANR